MKPASADLIALLATREYARADVITFELVGGTDEDHYRLRYTTAQMDLTAEPVDGSPGLKTWRSNQVLITGLRAKASVGLAVDEQNCVLTPQPGATVRGVSFQEAARRRVFDGAVVRRDRYYMARAGQAPVGGIPMFAGLVSTARNQGSKIFLKVKSAPVLLDQQMPRHLNQSTCIYTVYDSGCGLVKEANAVAGIVGADPTRSVIPWAGAASIFTRGVIFFENMGDVGERRTIRKATGTELILAYPLPIAPTVGGDFVAFKGCDGSSANCTALGNLARRRSYDFVPNPEDAI